MRIAFYSPRASHLDPVLASGGDPIFIENLLGALRSRGHEVWIVSRLNVRHLWRGMVSKRQLLAEARRIRSDTRRFRPDAWLVYNPSRTYPDLFGWWQRPPRYVLLSAHTWQSKRIPGPWRRLFALAFARSIARADAFVVTKPASIDRLRKFGVPSSRLHVHTFATNVPANVPAQESARRRLDLPLDAPVMLCTTRFTSPGDKEGKTEMILGLLEIMPSVGETAVLVLVGDGPGRAQIEEKAAELVEQGRVRIFGAVENEQLALFRAASDFYVYPHPLDRPWLSVLEAQAHGLPVVTLRTRSAEITVAADESGLLADDMHEFTAFVAALAADRDRCAAMGRAARRYIQQVHSIDVRAGQIEDLLKRTSRGPEVAAAAGRSRPDATR